MPITLNGSTGITTPAIDDSGNLVFTGTGNRITGDFSNATVANRVAFQTSTVNGNSLFDVIPNGTATATWLAAVNNSNPTNAGVTQIVATSSESQIKADRYGTGTYLPMTIYTGGSERMRVDTSGNLLVGKTTFSATTAGFQVNGNTGSGSFGAVNSCIASSANANSTYEAYSTTAGAYRFYVGMGGTIFATSTSITAISDQSLKENIRDLDTGLTQVMALRPRRFDWKEETQIGEKNVAGFIAQEVEQVLPELVYDYQYTAEEKKKSVKMGDILPTLVKAIQELNAKVDAQAAEIAALKGQA